MSETTDTTIGGTAPATVGRIRTAGAWLGFGGLAFVVGLLLHAPPSADTGQFMATIANGPTQWMAAHWISAIAISSIIVGGLLVLTSDSRLTEKGVTTSAWAVLIVAGVVLLTAALTEATVSTAAAVAGDTATFEAWQAFAEGHAIAFVFVGLSVAVIAGNEARGRYGMTPGWVSWIGAAAGILAPLGFVLGVGVGIAIGGIAFIVFSIVLSLWLVWFGIGLARAPDGTMSRSGEPEAAGV